MVSLFTGAGGLDYGFEAAGFTTSIAIDADSNCIATLQANRPWHTMAKDITQAASRDLTDIAGLNIGDIDIVIGGPPCQPFSRSGYWVNGDTRRLKDRRANTLYAYMRCINDLKPEVFVLENVHGIAYSGKDEGFIFLKEMTNNINRRNKTNYKLSYKILNAAKYGVPQLRQRFFLIGHREGKTFKFPDPTHAQLNGVSSEKNESSNNLDPYVTTWDAIGNLDNNYDGEDLHVSGRWGDLLPSIPEGHNYLWHTDRGGGLPLFGWRTRYWSFLLKLAKNLPSWTVQANPGSATGPFHWKSRCLSVEELSRIQTFPRDIKFMGSRISIRRQIGNAVPSLLAETLAREIGEQFFDISTSRLPKLAVEIKRPIPPPEPLQSIPDKYFSLIGDHPSHPGKGKGPGRSNLSFATEIISSNEAEFPS